MVGLKGKGCRLSALGFSACVMQVREATATQARTLWLAYPQDDHTLRVLRLASCLAGSGSGGGFGGGSDGEVVATIHHSARVDWLVGVQGV